MTARETLKTARDFLLAHRTDYAAACAGFRWPRLEWFNFALDWFDAVDPGREALRIVGDGGAVEARTYGELSAASNRLANFLRGAGLRRGDAVLLMLGNEVALWESLLAAMKLGAVVIPTSTLLSASELADRLSRGRVRLVIAGAAYAERFPAGDWRGVSVGGAVEGWLDMGAATASPPNFAPDGETRGEDPLLLYFTSGTTSRPKLVSHSHVKKKHSYWFCMRTQFSSAPT